MLSRNTLRDHEEARKHLRQHDAHAVGLVLLFCVGMRLLRFSLVGNNAVGAPTALQLCFSEAVASASSGDVIER